MLRKPRNLLVALSATLVFGILVAVPSVLIPNPFFRRMTPVRWQDFLFVGLTAPLMGISFAVSKAGRCGTETRSLAGGVGTYLAVGCPICNKLVVAALGVSGALTYFGPLQPVIGAAALMLVLLSLRRQLRGTCGVYGAPDSSRADDELSAPRRPAT